MLFPVLPADRQGDAGEDLSDLALKKSLRIECLLACRPQGLLKKRLRHKDWLTVQATQIREGF